MSDGTDEKPNPDIPRFLPTVITLFNEAEAAGKQQDHGPMGHFLFQLSLTIFFFQLVLPELFVPVRLQQLALSWIRLEKCS